MAWVDLDQVGVTVRSSAVESERFGLAVDRVTIGTGPIDPALAARLDDRPADVLVVRYDAARLDVGAVLAQGRRVVLPAGALTYWDTAVEGTATEAVVPPDGLDVRAGDSPELGDVASVLRDVVRASFTGYGNHYAANPLFDRAAALAGYEDWAVRSAVAAPEDVLVLRQDGRPIGAATLEDSGAAVEVLLAGLVPEAQGRRLYDWLLRACVDVTRDRGARRLVISTQVHNVRVQRAWARAGLRPFAAVETVHLVEPGLLRSADAVS
ncbi:GNAT family N-acetyltransferase [Actinotalea sp. JY-7876]|uniref:GNAT family N-acetyltransferase n=1 Tax=Actinotalea sp. JY-7876 TaxID=2758442 RepID=UPI0015F401A0|nr:GNAT family N-acetyltransferase [Actinotalea sp. JY-7876]